jgi:hypothetical protein
VNPNLKHNRQRQQEVSNDGGGVQNFSLSQIEETKSEYMEEEKSRKTHRPLNKPHPPPQISLSKENINEETNLQGTQSSNNNTYRKGSNAILSSKKRMMNRMLIEDPIKR